MKHHASTIDGADMTTATRSDIHRVSQIIPEDYEYLFSFSYPDGYGFGYNMALLTASRTGKTAYEPVWGTTPSGYPVVTGRRPVEPHFGKLDFFEKPNGKGGCDVCGANYKDGDVWRHKATGEAIMIGHICADKYGLLTDRTEFKKAKRVNADRRAAVRIRRERTEALREWRKTNPEVAELLKLDHHIARDMRGRLIRRPEKGLSEPQVNLLKKLNDEANRPPKKHVPVPFEGRGEIEGTIVSTKIDDWGNVKMTVKVETPDGSWLVWGTAPNALFDQTSGPLKGRKVAFTAAVQKGNRDPHFGFFKRPTKAKLLD